MKRHLSALLALLLIVCMALTGCGGEKLDSSLAGEWTYNFYDIVLNFDEEGGVSYKTPKAEGRLSYFFDGSVLSLTEGEAAIGSATLNEDGNLVFEGLNGCFRPQGVLAYEPMSKTDSMLMGTNSELGKTRSYLADSAVFFNKDKDYYQRVDADWTVVVGEPEISGGYKTISAAAACFIPMSNVPLIDFPFKYNCGLFLYDKYTGLVFSTCDFYELGEDDFIYSFDSEQGRVDLSLHRGRENSGPTGDCYDVMGFTYTFCFPEWYDGLMVAPVPKPDTLDELLLSFEDPENPLGLMILPYSKGLAESGLRYNIK